MGSHARHCRFSARCTAAANFRQVRSSGCLQLIDSGVGFTIYHVTLVSPGGCLKLVKTMMYSLPTRKHDRRTIRDQQWLACSIRLQAGCAQGETGLLFDDETCSTDLYHPSTDLRRTSCAVHEHRHGGVCCNIPRHSLSAVESDTGIESQPEESDACGMLV